MRSLAQGAAQIVDVIVALRAGQDLLLGTADAELIARMEQGVAQAEKRGLLDRAANQRSLERLAAIRQWLRGFEQPPLEVVGCAEHQALAAELAARSVTLVRDDAGLLPLRLGCRRTSRGRPLASVRPDAGRYLVVRGADAGQRRPSPLPERRRAADGRGAGRGDEIAGIGRTTGRRTTW